MAKPQLVNKYKVTVVSKYKDFDGQIRESKKEKIVFAKTETGAINQVTKKTKQIVKENDSGKMESHWNDPASKFVAGHDIQVELLESEITLVF